MRGQATAAWGGWEVKEYKQGRSTVILGGSGECCIGIKSSGSIRYMTVNDAIDVSALLQEAVNQYFKENPGEIMEEVHK